MPRPRKYPPELLDRGARLVFESGRPIAHVARDLGVPSETLRRCRLKPKTVGAHLLSVVAAFRGMQPKTRLVLVASCALILVASIIGIAAAGQTGGDTPKPSATQTAPSTAPSAEPADTTTTGAQPSATASETSDADASASSEPDAERVVTAANSKELAALLKVRDYCDQSIASFASKYAPTGPSSSTVRSQT